MRSVPCAHPTAIRDPSLDTARQDTSPERERGGGRGTGGQGERREGGREERMRSIKCKKRGTDNIPCVCCARII